MGSFNYDVDLVTIIHAFIMSKAVFQDLQWLPMSLLELERLGLVSVTLLLSLYNSAVTKVSGCMPDEVHLD